VGPSGLDAHRGCRAPRSRSRSVLRRRPGASAASRERLRDRPSGMSLDGSNLGPAGGARPFCPARAASILLTGLRRTGAPLGTPARWPRQLTAGGPAPTLARVPGLMEILSATRLGCDAPRSLPVDAACPSPRRSIGGWLAILPLASIV